MKQIYYSWRAMSGPGNSNAIKIISVALGLLMTILLMSRMALNHSFDTCYENHRQLYQLWMQYTINGNTLDRQQQCLGKLAGAIYEELPEMVVAATTTSRNMGQGLFRGDTKFSEKAIAADSLFFKTMGIEVLKGDPVIDLTQKDVVYLSESYALMIFGGDDPIGEVLKYNNEWELTVKGIYRDLPDNVTTPHKAVISMPSLWSREWGNYSWNGGDSWPEFIRVADGVDPVELNRRINEMLQKNLPDTESLQLVIDAAPLTDTYMSNDEVRRMDRIMLVLSLALLFITTLNYVLITIASLSKRAKSIGIHKCNGAGSPTIFSMFIIETLMVLGCALVLMVILTLAFGDMIKDTINITPKQMLEPSRLWVPISVMIIFVLIGGIIPGRIFSRIPVSNIFRRFSSRRNPWTRTLLCVEFAGVTFIVCMMTVAALQYHEVMNHDLGYNPERVVIAEVPGQSAKEVDAAYNALRDLPVIEGLSASYYNPVWGYSGMMVSDNSGNDLFSSRYDACINGYIDFMGMTLIKGREPRDDNEIAVNEEFARLMNWGDDIVGRIVPESSKIAKHPVTVTGLLRDFNIGGFFEEPMPYLMFYSRYFYPTMYLRVMEPFKQNLMQLEESMKELFPAYDIEFSLMEKEISDTYENVRQFRNATVMACVVILFITLMGFIGYIRNEVQRRGKEIAIRKVNGAESHHLFSLLIRDIVSIAVPSIIAGAVAAWFTGKIWLEQFTVEVNFLAGYYILASIAVLVAIVLCVYVMTRKIVNENPVIRLKNE